MAVGLLFCTWNTLYKGRDTHTHTQSKRVIYYTHTQRETDSAGPAIISWVITYGENETSFPFSLVDSGWPFLPSFLPSTDSCVCVCVCRCTTYLVSSQVLVLVSPRLYGHPHSFLQHSLYISCPFVCQNMTQRYDDKWLVRMTAKKVFLNFVFILFYYFFFC